MISREEIQAMQEDLRRQQEAAAEAEALEQKQQEEAAAAAQAEKEAGMAYPTGSRPGAFGSIIPEQTQAQQDIQRAGEETRPVNPDDERSRGLLTQVGEFLQDAADAPANLASELTGGLIPSADQQRENAMQIPVVGPAVVGGGLGIESGLLTPITLGARATNQQTPWTQKPEVLEGSPVGEAAFNIMEILTPTLIAGAAIPGGIPGGAVGVIGESALETAIQTENNDDIIAGRSLATSIGEIAEYLYPGSGAQITEELIRGETPTSQAFTAAVGFVQNLGINVTANAVVNRVTRGAAKPAKEVTEAAEASGKSEEAVQASIDNVTTPDYRPDMEPSEVTSVLNDTDVPVSKPDVPDTFNPGSFNQALDDAIALDGDPAMVAARDRQNVSAAWEEIKRTIQSNPSKAVENTRRQIRELKADIARARKEGNDYWADQWQARVDRLEASLPSGGYINSDALTAETLRQRGLDDDFLTAGDRKYFSNIAALSDDIKVQNMIDEATKSFRRLSGRAVDEAVTSQRVTNWWAENAGLLVDPADDYAFDMAASSFAREFTSPTSTVGKVATQFVPDMATSTYLREYATTDAAGFAAAAMIGDELGARAIKMARQAANLDANGIDFSNAIENLIELQDRIGTFMVPLRRSKREWSVQGVFQQRKKIRGLKDKSLDVKRQKGKDITTNSPSRDFEVIKKNEEDAGKTLSELWDAYKAGDQEAGKTLKEYVNLLAYSDAETAVSQVNNLTDALKNELFKGNYDAVKQLRYAAMLGRLGTQVVAAASSIGRLVAEPIGGIVSPLLGGGKKADAVYALGQLVGGASSIFDGLKAGARAFKTGQAINQGSKLDGLISDIKVRSTQLEETWQGLQRQMNAEGASQQDKFTAAIWYNTQRWALNPINQLATRGLTASDEFSKAVFGGQVAGGRAFVRAFEENNWKELNSITKAELDNIFVDGVRHGKIDDPDVLDAARNITFQGAIPQNGNFIDKGFKKLQDASDESAVFSFFFPFVRAGYNTLEVAARYEPSGQLRRIVPRYNAIMKGEMGEVARQQLQSQVAFGRLWTAGTAFLAWNGMVTGYNVPPGTPQTSILIPADNEDGYIAVPYGRLEPFATLMAVTSDMVQSLRYGAISEQDYQRAAQEMLFTIGMASFDKAFLSGMLDLTALMNFKQYGRYSGSSVSGAVANTVGGAVLSPLGQAQALTRMVASWTNPYVTINRDRTNWVNEIASSMKSRYLGGHGNPIRYNIYTGEPMRRTIDLLPGQNRFTATVSSMLNELSFPGNIHGATVTKEQKEMEALGFEHNEMSALSTYQGVELSPDLQSKLSAGMHKYGKLSERLKIYFNSSEYKRSRQRMKDLARNTGNSNEGSPADVERKKIHAELRKIFRAAKEAAAQRTIRNEPEFQQLRMDLSGRSGVAELPAKKNTTAAKAEGLIAWVNGEIPTTAT